MPISLACLAGLELVYLGCGDFKWQLNRPCLAAARACTHEQSCLQVAWLLAESSALGGALAVRIGLLHLVNCSRSQYGLQQASNRNLLHNNSCMNMYESQSVLCIPTRLQCIRQRQSLCTSVDNGRTGWRVVMIQMLVVARYDCHNWSAVGSPAVSICRCALHHFWGSENRRSGLCASLQVCPGQATMSPTDCTEIAAPDIFCLRSCAAPHCYYHQILAE